MVRREYIKKFNNLNEKNNFAKLNTGSKLIFKGEYKDNIDIYGTI